MVCPHCNFENSGASAYCEQCGTLLQNFTQYAPEEAEYKAPPPPPLNGHNALPLPPPLEYTAPLSPPPSPPAYATQSQMFEDQIFPRPGIGVFSGFLYFIGTLITILGVLGIIVTFGSGTSTGLVGLLLAFALLITSIVIFIRQRRRVPLLRWWQRILWILGATLGAFIILIVEVIISPNAALTNYFTGCVILLYGLAWTGIAVW